MIKYLKKEYYSSFAFTVNGLLIIKIIVITVITNMN